MTPEEDFRRALPFLMPVGFEAPEGFYDHLASELAGKGFVRTPATPPPTLLEALRAYQQADEDGVMVLVSRQACDEAATLIEAIYASQASPASCLRAHNIVEG